MFLFLQTPSAFCNKASIKAGDEFLLQLQSQAEKSKAFMRANISPQDGLPGSVVAAPSKTNPDYYYHWVRDASLVMDSVVTWQNQTSSTDEKVDLYQQLKNFVSFTELNQATLTLTGLGEPKFYVDGNAYTNSWGRPQNDGPALRALTLIHFANTLLQSSSKKEANGEEITYVKAHLYSPTYPANTTIKNDLEYVAKHWSEPSYDVWEEVKGDHFYNRMVQRRALLEGADLAEVLNDQYAANYYRAQASAIKKDIANFFNSSKPYILTTRNRVDGVDYKISNLDTVTILAVLHGPQPDGFFSVTDDRVLATAQALNSTFEVLYVINQKSYPGTGIGRYPEDRYDGMTVSAAGNPWFLTTHAMAELYYKMARAFRQKGFLQISKTNLSFLKSLSPAVKPILTGRILKSGDLIFDQLMDQLVAQGDAYLAQSMSHMNQNSGSMSEQFNRYSGYMQGAHDLTWSYASFLTAYWSRPQ